jgi:hypothetical protein
MASALPASAFNVSYPKRPIVTDTDDEVARWSLLGVGVVYGAIHNNSLHKQAEYKRKQEEYHFKEQLIAEARTEYRRKKNQSGVPGSLPTLSD